MHYVVHIATRNSRLALWQIDAVANSLGIRVGASPTISNNFCNVLNRSYSNERGIIHVEKNIKL